MAGSLTESLEMISMTFVLVSFHVNVTQPVVTLNKGTSNEKTLQTVLYIHLWDFFLTDA